MSYGGQRYGGGYGGSMLPALDVQQYNVASPLEEAAKIQQLQGENALQPARLQALNTENAQRQSELTTYNALQPGVIAQAKAQSQLQQANDFQTQVGQVAKQVQALDPDERADYWDAQLKKLAGNGNVIASQYIGHYRDDLAQSVSDTYGTGAQAEGGRQPPAARSQISSVMNDPEALQRTIAQMTPPQRVQSLKIQNALITAFNGITNEQSFNAAIDDVRRSGFPVDRFISPSAPWQTNYAAIHNRIQSMVPERDALADYVARETSGAPIGAAAPLGQSMYIGSQPGTQFPVYHNPVTNQDTTGTTPVGPKPSAAISTFMFKQRAGLDAGMTPDQALEFANGKRDMSPAQMQEAASAQAGRDLADLSLAGAPPADPKAYLVQQTQAHMADLANASGTGGGGAPPPPQKLAPAVALSQAKAAIAQGAPRAAVLARLKQMGVPVPAGF
jgi:hypothetical protein